MIRVHLKGCSYKSVFRRLSEASVYQRLGPLPTDPPSQLDVLGHDGDPLGVDGAQVCVLEETHQVRLASLLKGHHSRALEPQVGLEVLGNLTNEPLEGQLADEQLSGFLVPWDQQVRNCEVQNIQAYLLISLRATVPGL